MYYTYGMRDWLKRTASRLFGLLVVLALASCGGGNTPLATSEADSAPTSHPPALNRVSVETLPKVCNCVLRFDRISIEQGLSQSSVFAVFQDSRGFMWFGTEDGLNRYDGYSFKIYKPDPESPDSISDRWITAIMEDEDGYLWIGTRQGGLNRYDPRLETFTRYLHDDAVPSSLTDNHINVLFMDREKQLWIGTMHGLDRLDKTRNTFTHYLAAPAKHSKTGGFSVTAIHQDQLGQLWIGTDGGGLKILDLKSGLAQTILSNPDNPSSISNDHITAIAEDANSNMWVGTRNGLNRFNPRMGLFDRFQRAELSLPDPPPEGGTVEEGTVESQEQDKSISSDIITVLKLDGSGNLWIGTTNGLNRYEPDEGFVHYYNDPSFPRSLSENKVVSIYEDHSGALWIGTRGGGVNIYDRQRDLFAYYRHDPQDPNTISGNMIFPIVVDEEGYAWIGASGSGLNRFDWKTNEVIRYQTDPLDPNSLGSNDVLSIHGDQDGILWIGTSNGLDRFDRITSTFTHFRRDPADTDSLSSNYVYKVFVDGGNTVWVGTSAGLDRLDRDTGKFAHYTYNQDDPTSLSGSTVYSIFEDREGRIWVGTFESGLNRFDPETGTFTRYRYDPQDKASINNDSVMAIYQDSQGRIWVGTAGGGLNRYHPETDSFDHYIEKDGLPNGVIYGILEDESGDLWLSTNYGISRFNPQTKTFRNYDAGDGLQSNEFNSSAYAKGKNGEFYFGGINGLTVFRPGDIADNPFAPSVALISLTQDDQPVATDSSVETLQAVALKYPRNSFEFNFVALSYNQPGKNQYAYLLEGFDTNWHYIGTKRDGRYTNLPGGEYTLLLKATNSDGVWNETPSRIKVTVIPPIWQTNWFRLLIAMTAVVVIAGGVGLRTRSIRDRNRALERIVQERTHALEKRNREIEALYEADERILRNVSLNQVFQTLVDVAVDMLHADRSVVFAWDENETKVVPRVSHGFSPETLKVMHFAKGEGIVGEVLSTGKPAIFRDVEPNSFRPEVRAAILAEGIRSFVHLPIIVDHKVVGVFNVGFTTPDLIGDDAIRLFSALTHRASISIANMELFEQTKDLAVMEERNRLARDLHDSAKQKAFAALAQLGTARGILNGNGNSATMHLNEAENLVSDVIQELTFLVQEIYPIALQEKGLAATLREYIYEWENRNDTKVQLVTRSERRLSIEIEQAIFRVIQETLANVARHSNANRVDVSLVYNGDSVQLSVSDDGCGFDVNQKIHGMGLRSIRERVSSIRGTVQVQSAPGRGTRVLVQVPTKG